MNLSHKSAGMGMDGWGGGGGCEDAYHICIFNSYQIGVSILYYASWKGYITIVQTLLAAGADMNTATFNVRLSV